MLTPFNLRGQVDEEAFIRNIERWNKTNLSGYVALGSNSEAVYLSEREKLRLIELTAKHATPGRMVIAGTGLESTRCTIELTSAAAASGAQVALVITPSFYGDQMTDEAMIHHFSAVADQSKIPVVLYNVPKYTHINLSTDVVRTLSLHPNIIGMKDSKGEAAQLGRYLKVAKAGFQVIAGSASVLLEGLKLGCRSSIAALANVLPNECAEVVLLFEAGRLADAEQLQARLIPLNVAVTQTFGVAGLKFAASLRGYEGGEVRSPLLPLTRNDKAAIEKLVAALNA